MSDSSAIDIIVVGGGHAGTEAALAAARMGARILLVTQSLETIGQMSCNPAIGGIGKGHLVREIDAMGGIMGRCADQAGIQLRTLNASKGPAVRATRAQCDRNLYRRAVTRAVQSEANLRLFQQGVEDLLVENGRVAGVRTQLGLEIRAPAVVLTVGTFLGGRIHVGERQSSGGRAGDPAANALASRLREMPFRVERLKTGTPPRLDGRSVDFASLTEQPGDQPLPGFSYWGRADEPPTQVPCHITHTNSATHELIREALHRSPMYSGRIEGAGPRYCPSIEDKVVRFAERDSHQIFVEPEGLETHELYPNGISTSLPFEVQRAFLRSIRGFERAEITRPGYAIEYDFFDPRDLNPTLETRHLPGLFFAGQINGTTGYEEAAAQGLLAGVNAVRLVRGEAGWAPARDEAYLGVLVDDLITAGTSEPYRMFTSRAEHRLLLREDNAHLRLTPVARELGLVDDAIWNAFERTREAIERETARLSDIWATPGNDLGRRAQAELELTIGKEVPVIELLKRPGMSYRRLMSLQGVGPGIDDERAAEQVEIQVRYQGYIERQRQEIDKARRQQNTPIPEDFDYAGVRGLSAEVMEKLSRQRPSTVGQASRIPGVTPAAISLLLVFLKRHRQQGVRRQA